MIYLLDMNSSFHEISPGDGWGMLGTNVATGWASLDQNSNAKQVNNCLAG